MTALYQAIERLENHASTMGVLLKVLRAGYRNARGDDALRAELEREIEYYVERQAELHADRAKLSAKVMRLRERKTE